MKPSTNTCKAIAAQNSLATSRAASPRPWAQAMLDVLQRRGRTYGLLAHYEESRLNAPVSAAR